MALDCWGYWWAWLSLRWDTGSPYSLVCFTLCFFVTATIVMEFFRGARVIRIPLWRFLSDLRHRADHAQYAALWRLHRPHGHGVDLHRTGRPAFNQNVQKEMQPGSSMEIGKYKLVLQNFDSKPEANYTGLRLNVEVFVNNKPLMMLYPERRIFETNGETGTMVAIYSTLREDLYVVYAGQSPGHANCRSSTPT